MEFASFRSAAENARKVRYTATKKNGGSTYGFGFRNNLLLGDETPTTDVDSTFSNGKLVYSIVESICSTMSKDLKPEKLGSKLVEAA
jgi:hypothetical protein